MASHYVHLAQSQIEERVRKDAQLDPLGARIQADPNRAIADVASAAAATSSAAVIKALFDAGVLPKPGADRRDDDEDGAASPPSASDAHSRLLLDRHCAAQWLLPSSANGATCYRSARVVWNVNRK